MNADIFSRSIIPSVEIGSYEALWLEDNAFGLIKLQISLNHLLAIRYYPQK